jgi:hypothetical protein
MGCLAISSGRYENVESGENDSVAVWECMAGRDRLE